MKNALYELTGFSMPIAIKLTEAKFSLTKSALFSFYIEG